MTNKTQIIVTQAIIFNANFSQVLLAQRYAPDHPEVDKKWQFAGGGVEQDEDPSNCVVREAQEELGVVITVLDPRPIVISHVWKPQPGGHKTHTQAFLLGYLAKLSHPDQSITLNDESRDYGWFTLEEVQKLDTLPNVKEALHQAWELAQSL